MRAQYSASSYSHFFTPHDVQHFLTSVCNCTSVILQDLPNSTTQEHVIQYLQQNRLQTSVLQFDLIRPNKLALNFSQPQLAYRYYIEYNLSQNFRQNLLNTYLNINFDQKYLNKFLLIGVNETNQKNIFPSAKRFGIIKINFICKELNESSFMAFLSLADAHVFTMEKYNRLKASLSQFGIITKIFNQCRMSTRFQVCLNEFLDQGIYKKNQVFLIVWNIIAALKLSFESAPLVYIQSQQSGTNWQFGGAYNKVYARIICSNDAQAKELNAKLTQHSEKHKKGHLILNVRQNTNSYANILTKDLRILRNMTEYDFKTILLKEYRRVTPQLANLVLYKTERDRVYHAKLFFENQLAGRKFLAYYNENIQNLRHFYAHPQRISFQMYIDKQTIYEYDQYLYECHESLTAKDQNKGVLLIKFQPSLKGQYSRLHPYFNMLPLEKQAAVIEEKAEEKKEDSPSKTIDLQ